MRKKKTGLKVNYGAVEKIPLKRTNPLTDEQRAHKVRQPKESLFRRLQKENNFVSGTGLGNAIADVFGNFTQSAGNRQEPIFDETTLPQTGPGRMQPLDEVVISTGKKKNDNNLLYIVAAIGIFLIIKAK